MREYSLWLIVAAAAVHVLEEFSGNWVAWARSALSLDVDWPTFFVTNATMIFALVAFASIGWQAPEFSLIGAALIAINAIFFHIGIALVQRRWSPGTFTATVLYLPAAAFAYIAACDAGVLSGEVVAISVIGGALFMAFPVVLIKLKPRIDRSERLD